MWQGPLVPRAPLQKAQHLEGPFQSEPRRGQTIALRSLTLTCREHEERIAKVETAHIEVHLPCLFLLGDSPGRIVAPPLFFRCAE